MIKFIVKNKFKIPNIIFHYFFATELYKIDPKEILEVFNFRC
jgi:hypothetical protein